MSWSGNKLLLPFYHSVTDHTPIHLKHLYSPRSIQEFKKDLDYLLEYYLPISLHELIEITKSNKLLDKNCFH